ncbi:MAG: FHA domain-containing protein [Pirellulales bacterium]
MTEVTLRVLDGANRGDVFEDLPTPITIGREEGNSIQLNDERVSRFHVKLQDDQENVVLTDLESTNGTKVNGEEIQLRILRYGDVVHVGRSLLLYGSRPQIAQRLAMLREMDSAWTSEDPSRIMEEGMPAAGSLEFEFNWDSDPDLQNTLHTPLVPELPQRLSPAQAAQLSELLEYVHVRLRHLINSGKIKGVSERIVLESRQWQNLLDLQGQLSQLLRSIGEPNG